MLPAMLPMLPYIGLTASIQLSVEDGRKIFSQIGLSFDLIAAAILLGTYDV